MAVTPTTHLEKFIAGEVEPITHLEQVIAEYGGGGGGGESTIAWKPTVSEDGTISWTRTSSTTKPADQNIKGEDGEDGYSPTVTITPITGGNRVTITDADGDHTFDVMNGSGGGDAVLTAALTTSKTVGGISSGKQYEANTPLETLFRDMLNPVENPTLTNPSATISAAGGTLVEEGVDTNKTLTVNFDRGKINWIFWRHCFQTE